LFWLKLKSLFVLQNLMVVHKIYLSLSKIEVKGLIVLSSRF
jgi:hypothetical protein